MMLKQRLAAGDVLLGTFVKTPNPVIVEVLAGCGLDLVCLDAEHAPFDRGTLDACIFAARACNLAVLVRPPTHAAEHILNALDCGADGVLLPHIRSAADAAEAVRAAHYRPGGRGYAGSSRAAGYGLTAMAEHRRASAERTCVIAQIEDVEALDAIEAIAAVPGLAALFVGRIDLTVALDAASPDAPEVIAAVERILAAAAAAHLPCGMFVPANGDVPGWRARGARLFLQSSDHGLIRSGAVQLRAAFGG
ncbi:MAG: aldolase [Blastomonas sp. CACIA14H2]|uniref:HpcH/HpaI aldolase family protein n=1 Tax=Blastomonas sp. CACIA14H2 TaxID=1419876 RepID=UPI0003D00AA0|nr:MAG: aldolase [Blastomonas sp. CACIA14H2]